MSNFDLVKKLATQANGTASNKKLKSMISAIANDQVSKEEADTYEAKGVFSYSDMIEVLELEIKKQNRVKHTFKTLTELNAFEEENECGEYWNEDKLFCVYAY